MRHLYRSIGDRPQGLALVPETSRLTVDCDRIAVWPMGCCERHVEGANRRAGLVPAC